MHQLLKDISASLSQRYIAKHFEFGGHKYTIQTLTEDDENWVDSYVRSDNPLQMISSRRAPRLAASIKAIDGIPIEHLVDMSGLDDERRKALEKEPVMRRYWVYGEFLKFIATNYDRDMVIKLTDEINKLDKRMEEAVKELPK